MSDELEFFEEQRIGPSDRRACRECPNFIRLAERLKAHDEVSAPLLQEVPPLLSFKNKALGLAAALSLVFVVSITALFILMALFKSEIRDTVTEMKIIQGTTSDSVNKIRSSVSAIETTTQVLNNTVQMSVDQAKREQALTNERVKSLETIRNTNILRKYNNVTN